MKHLLEFAADLTNHDPMIASAIEAALRSPPMTNEEVGFYGAAKNPPEMNCFLYLVTSLGNAGYTFSAEDKYSAEILDIFAQKVDLPARIRSWFPKRLGWDSVYEAIGLNKQEHGRASARFQATYEQAFNELEAAFEARGERLRVLEFHVGDTIPFVVVKPEVAEKWDNVVLGYDRQGRPLCLSQPDWQRFAEHLAYSAGFPF
ncbi:hypothetical protein FRD01_14485 [Microvenator marinus]|uniref:Uncharacterized protein n=1 Tax=Microvenator marinus TaxID=2600177 RepID=A0A5B8XYB3_9DELT|nr:hypothetical protein [Microvenator marinus]QED28419.1 hypothetical protein FRD01_14485 [Microvenator marinus]